MRQSYRIGLAVLADRFSFTWYDQDLSFEDILGKAASHHTGLTQVKATRSHYGSIMHK